MLLTVRLLSHTLSSEVNILLADGTLFVDIKYLKHLFIHFLSR